MGLAKKINSFANPLIIVKKQLSLLTDEELLELTKGTTSLKEYCRVFGYSYNRRKQGRRYYVRISHPDVSERHWKQDYDFAVKLFYPDAYMTSGSSFGATYMIGDVFELLKR